LPKFGTSRLRNGFTELLAVIVSVVVATLLQALIALPFAVPPPTFEDSLLSGTAALVLYPFIAMLLWMATPGVTIMSAGPKRAVFGRPGLFASQNASLRKQTRR
jgi:cell shape-determining protein MreD